MLDFVFLVQYSCYEWNRISFSSRTWTQWTLSILFWWARNASPTKIVHSAVSFKTCVWGEGLMKLMLCFDFVFKMICLSSHYTRIQRPNNFLNLKIELSSIPYWFNTWFESDFWFNTCYMNKVYILLGNNIANRNLQMELKLLVYFIQNMIRNYDRISYNFRFAILDLRIGTCTILNRSLHCPTADFFLCDAQFSGFRFTRWLPDSNVLYRLTKIVRVFVPCVPTYDHRKG